MNHRYILPPSVKLIRQRKARLLTRRTAGVIAILALLANVIGFGTNLVGGMVDATGPHSGSPKFKADLKQWADQVPAKWQHGDLNRNNSDYQEGQSVPFKLELSNLTSGKDYTIRVRYDFEKKEPSAYDYLTTYNFSRSPSPIPAGDPVMKSIPTDTGLSFSQMPGSFALWGGTFVGNISGPVTNKHEKMYDLTLRATSSSMTLLWGGHLASAANWGQGLGAGSISGAPFHMAISRIVDGKETSSQDRSIHLDQGNTNRPPGDVPPGNGAVCAQGDVKKNDGSGYEYTDGSATITIVDGVGDVHNSATWAATNGFVITSVCVKIGGPGGGSLIYPNVNDAQAGPYSYDISHVVIKTDPINPPDEDFGTLTINKIVDSGNASPDAFSFTINPDPNNVGTVHTTNGSYTFTNLPENDYTVTELGFTGYHQVSSTCADVEVEEEENASCTIHNAQNEVPPPTPVTTISLDKSGPATVAAAGQITYTLAWSVGGNTAATNAIITDPIPANTTFVSADNGGTFSAGTVTWNLGTKNPGDSGTVHVVVSANAGLANGTVITNVGTFDTDQNQPLNDSVNTTVQVTPPPPPTPQVVQPTLSITKSNNLTTFTTPGSQVTYTVVVTNAATATLNANNVVLTDVLPAGFTYVVDGGSTKNFNLGSIAPGVSVTTTYVAAISATHAAGTFVNTATAKGDNTNAVSATSAVEIRVPVVLSAEAAPQLKVEKTAGISVVNPGGNVTYTITVKNVGNAPALDVVLTDTLPVGFTFHTGGGHVKQWELGTINEGETKTIKYKTDVSSEAVVGTSKNTAVVTSSNAGKSVVQAPVELKPAGRVLGLAVTGAGLKDYGFIASGMLLIVAGFLVWRKLRRDEQNVVYSNQ